MSKKHVFGTVLAVTAAAAVAGGVVCYLNREKIKESDFYKKNDIDGKIAKVKDTIKEYIPSKDEEDIFDEDEFFAEVDASDIDTSKRGYVSIHTSEVAEEAVEEVAPVAEEATTATEEANEETTEEETEEDVPSIAYENEGLSDMNDDPETLKEQDSLE